MVKNKTKDIRYEINKSINTVLADSVAMQGRPGGIQMNFFNFLTEDDDLIHLFEQARVFIGTEHAKEFADQLCKHLDHYPVKKKELLLRKKK